MAGEPIRAAVIADTHGLLRPEVERILGTCDVIIHAGDFDTQMIYHKLSTDWPLYAVRGNNDRGWSGGLPLIKRFEIGGVKFIMAHERKDIPSALGDTQAVIYGHSHMYQQQEINGRLWLNPGSCGLKRFTLPLSLVVMTIESGTWSAETIWLEKGYGTPGDALAQREKAKKNRYEKRQKNYMQKHQTGKQTAPDTAGEAAAHGMTKEQASNTAAAAASEKEQLFLIARIMRFKAAGNTAEWTAENAEASREFVEKIYRLCEEIPGADARSLLRKVKGSAEDNSQEGS